MEFFEGAKFNCDMRRPLTTLAQEQEHPFITIMNIPNGLVLSGGKSMRMGKDKSLIAYHEGKPQREYMFDLLSECCERVFTSCRREQQIPEHLNPLPDRYAFGGPLNGILSAFALQPDKAWLVVAVDMPNVTLGVLLNLLSQRDPNRLATCFVHPLEGAPEPLLTVWEPAAFPLLLENAEEGNISPRSFLRSSEVKQIAVTDPTLFENINYPHQLPPGL
jgi:molybdopterin-guanine dinucleotide biosynthesis protein A